jgi:NADH:ubiquinone oxidoreductase subunit F (NADH-binding)
MCQPDRSGGKGGDILLSNNRLLNKLLAKNDALVTPLQTLLDDHAGGSRDGADHHEALVVEVGHDHDKSLVFFTEQVLDRDLDVAVFDECGSSGR